MDIFLDATPKLYKWMAGCNVESETVRELFMLLYKNPLVFASIIVLWGFLIVVLSLIDK